MRRLVAALPILALVALVAVFALRSLWSDPHVTPRATVGTVAPDETLPPLAGGAPTALKAQAAGGPVLVNFFASWCGPCAEEAPALLALKAEGVRVVGVAWKDDPADTKGFLARYGDPYAAVLVDRDGRAGIDFGVTGVPETYVLNPAGKILDKQATPLTAADAEALLRRADAGQ